MKRTIVLKKERKLQEETAMNRILDLLFWFPEVELSLTELAERADVSKSTASRLVKVLADNDIVKLEDKRIIFRIAANIESPEFIKRKIAFNLKTIYNSDIVEFLDQTFGHPKAILLCGSFRYGQDKSTSDIDFAIEVLEDVEMESVRPEGIEEYEKVFGRHLQVHRFNRNKIDPRVFNEIGNGIVLAGFLEVRP